jgi:hypothetical protein
MPSAELEPAIPASERLQTHVLEGAATGIASLCLFNIFQQYYATVSGSSFVNYKLLHNFIIKDFSLVLL